MAAPSETCNALLSLLGSRPTSPNFVAYLLTHHHCPDLPNPQTYPDAVYFSLEAQGISFVFDPIPPYKPKYKQTIQELQLNSLTLTAIDLYSGPLRGNTTFSACSLLPLTIPLPSEDQSTLKALALTPATSGRELVEALGEPDRKGGGSQRVPVWLEWTSHGIKMEMVRAGPRTLRLIVMALGQGNNKGLGAWDQKDEPWTCCTLFAKGEKKGAVADDDEPNVDI